MKLLIAALLVFGLVGEAGAYVPAYWLANKNSEPSNHKKDCNKKRVNGKIATCDY